MITETAAEELMAEAKKILNSLLKIPEGYSSGAAERFVDCVVGATVLTAVDVFAQAAAESRGEYAGQVDNRDA